MRIESTHFQVFKFYGIFGLTLLCPNRPEAAKEINAYVVLIASVTSIESIKNR